MAQNSKAWEPSRLASPKWIAVILALGFALILGSGRWGADWNPGQLIYDLGVTLIAVAFVELFILRILMVLASRKTAAEVFWDRMEQLRASMEKSHAENQAWLDKDHAQLLEDKSDDLKEQVQIIEERLELLDNRVEAAVDTIRRCVDPPYAEAMQRIEETERQRSQDYKPPSIP